MKHVGRTSFFKYENTAKSRIFEVIKRLCNLESKCELTQVVNTCSSQSSLSKLSNLPKALRTAALLFFFLLVLCLPDRVVTWHVDSESALYLQLNTDLYHQARRECDNNRNVSNHYLYSSIKLSFKEEGQTQNEGPSRMKRETGGLFEGLADSEGDVEMTPGPNELPWYPCEGAMLTDDGSGYWWLSRKINFDGGITIFCKGYEDIYISVNGYVTFNDPLNTRDSSRLPPGANILAPFFVAQDARCPGCQVRFRHYKCSDEDSDSGACTKAELDIQDYAKTNEFVATEVIVVCWENTHPYPWGYYWNYENDPTLMGNTYQLVLITNGDKTYAIYNYMGDSINAWPFADWIRMGYQFGEYVWEPQFLTGTYLMHSVDKIEGNTGIPGSWILPLFDEGVEICRVPTSQCVDWLSNTICACPVVKYLPPCPCNEMFAMFDPNYRYEYSTSNSNCYRSRFKISTKMQVSYFGLRYVYVTVQFYRYCCFIAGNNFWGFFGPLGWVRTGPLITWQDGDLIPGTIKIFGLPQTDNEGFEYCCKQSSEFCAAYYVMRPVDFCEGYVPPRIAIVYGDPHFVSLDGMEYTFNGVGEYVMVRTSDRSFQLQVRTARAIDVDGNTTDATVFVGMAGKAVGGPTFQVELTEDRTALKLLVDGKDKTSFLNSVVNETSYGDNVFVEKINPKELIVSFAVRDTETGQTQGWVLMISVGKHLLQLNTTVPAGAGNKTQGLLGNFNGDPADDFMLPDGTTISVNSTDSDIFFNFGQKWMTSAEESLFHYPDGLSWADFQAPEFEPQFDPCESAERDIVMSAYKICGKSKPCLFDYCATLDNETAAITGSTKEGFTEREKGAKNNIPVIDVPERINVTLGEETSFPVTVIDPDGDEVSVFLASSFPNASLDNKTGLFTWRPTSLDPVSIGFIAVDAKGGVSRLQSVKTTLCQACGEHGSCDFTQYHVSSNSTSFAVADCFCDRGWQGPECDVDVDGCSDNPCKQSSAVCFDLPPYEHALFGRAYNCSCPAGFKTFEGECVDIDECKEESHTCDHICINELGGYKCKCNEGYRLDPLDNTCIDVDECNTGTALCTQTCQNEEGGYICDCYKDYKLLANGTCQKDQEVVCDLPCEHFCVLSISGNPYCKCRPGYVAYGEKCIDVDECHRNSHDCSHWCVNTEGGYECKCPDGYVLGEDQRSCQACDPLHWGPDCGMPCSCGSHGVTCDRVTGCVCEGYWDGLYCDRRTCSKVIGQGPRSVVLAFTMTVDYQEEYLYFDLPETKRIVSQIRLRMTQIFDVTEEFLSVEVLCLRKHEEGVQVVVSVNYAEKLNEEDIPLNALTIFYYLKANTFNVTTLQGDACPQQDSLLVQVSQEEAVPVTDDPCFYHNAMNLCDYEMMCFDIDGVPVCGEAFTQNIDIQRTLWVACGLAGLLVLLLVVAYFVVKRRLQLRARSTDKGSSHPESVSGKTDTTYTGAYSQSRFVPAYRGWWPQGWSQRWGESSSTGHRADGGPDTRKKDQRTSFLDPGSDDTRRGSQAFYGPEDDLDHLDEQTFAYEGQ